MVKLIYRNTNQDSAKFNENIGDWKRSIGKFGFSGNIQFVKVFICMLYFNKNN